MNTFNLTEFVDTSNCGALVIESDSIQSEEDFKTFAKCEYCKPGYSFDDEGICVAIENCDLE